MSPWTPDRPTMERSNLARLMKRMGFRPDEYRAFHQRSVQAPASYVSAALQDLAFPWYTAPRTILEGWASGRAIHEAKWFRGARVSVYDVGVAHQLKARRGDEPAVIWENEAGDTTTLTFRELDREVDAVAKALVARGAKRGDLVGVMLPTTPHAVVLFYALQKIGAVFSPIATDMSAGQVAVRLKEGDIRFVVGADAILARGRVRPLKPVIDEACRAWPKVATVIVLPYVGIEATPMEQGRDLAWHAWIDAAAAGPTPPTVQPGPDDVTMVLFSSGTTGTPKGTRHGFAAWIEDMFENAYASDVRAGDRSFWLTNVGWMMFPWLLAAHGLGAAVVLYEGAFDHPAPDRILRLIERHRVTHAGLSPDPLRVIVDAAEAAGAGAYDLASLRELRSTGAPLTPALFERIGRVLGRWASGAWGGTDGCFCLGGGNPVAPRVEASMTPGPGMDVHVMTFDADAGVLRDTRPDEIGEVVVQAPFMSMTKGLLNDPSGERFRASYFGPKLAVPEDAVAKQELGRWWFHGDLARMDADGNLWILGRADDLLVVRGTNIDPTSVQDAVADLVAASAPVVCMDGDSSELFVFVVRRPGDEALPDDLEKLVAARVRERVNKRTPPKRVFVVTGIPATVNNKPQLRLVRSAFTGAPLGDTATLWNPEVLDEIRALGKAHFGR